MLSRNDFVRAVVVMSFKSFFENHDKIEFDDGDSVIEQVVSGKIIVDEIERHIYPFASKEHIEIEYKNYVSGGYSDNCICKPARRLYGVTCSDSSCRDCWEWALKYYEDNLMSVVNCTYSWDLPFFYPENK